MKSQELRERLLVASYLEAQKESLGDFLDPADIADQYKLERNRGQLRLIVDDLEKRGYIAASRTIGGGDEGGMSFRLSASGVEAAEELLVERL